MFRPCIDLHEGKVKQIVGGTLEQGPGKLQTNFVSPHPAEWFAQLYKRDGLKGGHVVMLGPGNEEPARAALAAFPGGMQIGGGINLETAPGWLDAGASHVAVTSWVFREGKVDWERLTKLIARIGKKRLVIDVSCRRRDNAYWVVTDRFKSFTSTTITRQTLEQLAERCDEFLVHAVDVEGLCKGVDQELVALLAECSPIPMTYAGGAKSIKDLELVDRIGRGKVDLTIGSALDIFGGTGIRYADAVAYNHRLRSP